MIIERNEGHHYTELLIYPGERQPMRRYTVVCMDIDIVDDRRAQPTARISPLTTTSATPEDLTRLATEYLFVAGAAAALQAEKRAAYAARFPEPSADPKNQWLNSLSDYEDSMRGDDA